jgi:hypothetical protein
LRTQYILIDYENVQPKSLSGLDGQQFKVFVFVGPAQKKIDIDVASALQRIGANAEYIRTSGGGKNALDFHIAFYMGELAARDPTASFHVISKDTGFDPLIQHLKDRNVSAVRSADFAQMQPAKGANAKVTNAKVTNAKGPAERIASAVANLRQRGKARPGTLRTLSGTLRTIFQNQLSDEDLGVLLEELKAKNFITVSGTKVSYSLPSD